MTIHIIGAGLIGSLLALRLKQIGCHVYVFEKRQDPRFSSVEKGRSINLILTSRGLKTLDEAGIKDDILELTTPVYGRRIHSLDERTHYQPYGRNNSECNLSISRNELNNRLIHLASEAGVVFYFDHELDHFNFETKTLFFKNGKTEDYHFCMGTDGSGSSVRKHLISTFQELYIERTIPLLSDYKELYLGHDKDGQPFFSPNELHIWPRYSHMLMALPNLDSSFTLTYYGPKNQDSKQTLSRMMGPTTKLNIKSFDDFSLNYLPSHFFKTEFPDIWAKIENLDQQFVTNPQGRLGTLKLSNWVYKDSIALMGDAAHAITPFFGQGMNAGFEDISCFVNLLRQNIARPYNNKTQPYNNLESVLNDYYSQRKQNTDAIADMALENFTEMSVSVADQNFLIKKKLESLVENQYPSAYRSRYGMIIYTLIPYSKALEAGHLQNQILDEILKEQSIQTDVQLNNLNWPLIDKKINSIWKPWLKENKIDLTQYK